MMLRALYFFLVGPSELGTCVHQREVAGCFEWIQSEVFVCSKTWGFPVVMPGMWDAHTHYGGTTCAALNDGFDNPC